MSLKAYALTTVDRAGDFIGLGTLSAAKEAQLEMMVNSVTDYIESYLGYRVKKTTYTNEEYDVQNGKSFNLKNFPVVSGEAFTLQRRNSGLNEDSWETIDSQYYHVENETGIVYMAGGNFNASLKGYRVTYTAGYDFDNSATFLSDTEAADIEMAAWLLIASVNERKKGGGGITSEGIGDYRVSYAKSMFENDDIKDILDKYKRIDSISVITPRS